MNLSVEDIVHATHGAYIGDETTSRRRITDFTWDSRAVAPGDLFIALPGEHVDGNDFVRAAIAAEAGAVICSRKPDDALCAVAGEFTCPLIVVSDGVKALSALAAAWRSKLHALVVGVTGSTGKTSTKDLLQAVLQERFATAATSGNYNNELGAPSTILSASEDTEVLIVEMGMRGFGQIKALCDIASPNIGVVTNVGVSHMELLGSRENIARAKAELLAALPPNGLAVVNADDDMTDEVIAASDLKNKNTTVMSFGFSTDADVYATDVDYDETGCATFQMHLGDNEPATVHLSLPGRHNVYNALAAATAAFYLGLKPPSIVHGLARAEASGMRMEILRSPRGITVVNDAYNANPDSMRASLDTLKSMDCPARRIAVLGDMAELGEQEYDLHVQLGHTAAEASLDQLVCIGSLAGGIATGAVESGMPADTVHRFDSVDDARSFLLDFLDEGDLVLLKASRCMGLERLMEGVVD